MREAAASAPVTGPAAEDRRRVFFEKKILLLELI